MEKKDRERKLLIFGSIVLAGFSFIYFFYKSVIMGAGFVDVKEYWRYMAYSIRGYDISTCAAEGIVLEDIGTIGGAIVLPWGRLLGNLIYPGFLPLKAVIIYYYILLCICTGLAGWYIYQWIKKERIGDWSQKENILFTICLLMMPLYWEDALNTGNMGGIFGVFLILSAFLIERCPWMASFLIAMAMIKPQNAALFMLVLLIKKKYKIICRIIGIMVISIITMGVYERVCSYFRGIEGSISLANKVLLMLKGYSGNGQGTKGGVLPFFTYGILDKLIDLGVSSYIVLAGSALLGMIFVVSITVYIKDCGRACENWIILFSIAALGSIFWCYKTPCDEIIVIFCNLLCVLCWKHGKKDIKNVLWILTYLISINMKVFRFWGRKVLPIELDTAIVTDEVLRIAVYVVMIVKLKKGIQNCEENRDCFCS